MRIMGPVGSDWLGAGCGELELGDFGDDEREEFELAWGQYRDSWPDWADAPATQDEDDLPKKGAWYFSAAQLTYNATTGDWASKSESVLSGEPETTA